MKITLIDDDEIVLLAHKRLLNSLHKDLTIKAYKCPEEFINDIKDRKIIIPDIIISDYSMQKINGALLLGKIGKIINEQNQIENKLNFYLVSSDINIEKIAKKCTFAFFKGFFKKPLDVSSIKKILNHQTVS